MRAQTITREPVSIPIQSIYGPVIQGEGPVIGRPTIFVRVGGCDYRCGKNPDTGAYDLPFVCDTLYAVREKYRHLWMVMTDEEIVRRVRRINKSALVTLSGGNPCLYDMELIVRKLKRLGNQVALETQGSIWQDWIPFCNYIVVSPKPPSSGMYNEDTTRKFLNRLLVDSRRVYLKFAISNGEDLEWALDVATAYNKYTLYLQPVCKGEAMNRDRLIGRYNGLCDMILNCGRDDIIGRARVLPQLHVIQHGNKRDI